MLEIRFMSLKYPLVDVSHFTKHGKVGFALDLDDTLAWTMHDCVHKIFNVLNITHFEGMRPLQFVQNFPSYSHFPKDFKNSKVDEILYQAFVSNDFQKNITPVPGAKKAIIQTKLPTAAYITARPDSVHNGSAQWLGVMGFPVAPIIMRPQSIPPAFGAHWKADVLRELYPQIQGIVDDNHDLALDLEKDYSGTVYLLSHKAVESSAPHIVHCSSWPEWEEKYKSRMQSI